jgi:hypothetical protein
MISTCRKFIYIHVPKTGGNSIQTALEPFSDDTKTSSGHQDGVERFGIVGPHTLTKHLPLESYRDVLGDISQYFVFHSARHPFHRAVSGYFSSSNWVRLNSEGGWCVTLPVWDAEEFLKFAARMKSMVSYIRVDGAIYDSNDVIRLESITADFDRVCRTLRVPPSVKLGHFNKTAGQVEQTLSVLRDKGLRRIIEDRFAEDMAYLGY